MKAFILALLAGHALSLPAPMVEPSENGALGFRVVNREANSEGHYEAVEMVVAAITEMVRESNAYRSTLARISLLLLRSFVDRCDREFQQ